ncbi:lysoplasmalogenase [Maricaulis sp.]|uniref:lysoplasmalogenase n=1 Tax=Maricaulis sp. TaxID=1486257 RepID=UPI002634B1AC|nr:lysoplasmalogenase [Maricaulis sp.]
MEFNTRDKIILAASLAFSLCYLILGDQIAYPANVVFKAMGIILLGLYAFLHGKPVLAIGLWLGSAGDAFLALEPQETALGIVSFGLGHIVYIVLFAGVLKQTGSRGLPGYIGAGLLAVFGAVMLIALQPHFGELRIPASIYNAIIMIMAILAVIGRGPGLAIIGALLFVVSDTVLAWRMFAGELPWAGWLVWVTYYLGQAGIALGLAQHKS